MVPNRNDHLRYRYGICLNDSCSKCKAKEIQQISARKEFVCGECEKPLRECTPPKFFGQKYDKIIAIVAGLLVIIGIVIVILLPSSGNKTPEETVVVVDSIAATVTEESALESPQLDSTIINAERDSLVLKAIEDSIKLAKADSILNAQRIAEGAKETIVEKTAVTISQSQTPVQTTSHKLSYGTWTGGWKNGKPHGTGTLTYSTSKTIDSQDPKSRVAQSGEYIVGEWDNGHLVQGRWFKKNGTKEVVIIGKAR